MKLSATQRECLSTFTELAMAARQSALEDAAKLIEAKTTIGGPSLDFIHGYMEAQKRFAASIRALAVGGAQE